MTYQGSQDIYPETQRVEYATLKGVSGDFRPLLRQLSSTHQDVAPRLTDLPMTMEPEALPCWTEDGVCPAAHLAPKILLCKTLMAPLFPDLQTETLGLGFVIPAFSHVMLLLIVSI